MPGSGPHSDPNPGIPDVVALAGRQFGVVARRQLLRMGLSESRVKRLVTKRFLNSVFPGVYAVGATEVHGRGLVMAAVLACGDRAVASHLDAAQVWGLLDKAGRTIDVTRPARTKPRGPKGIRPHHVRSLQPDDVAVVDGVPVTSLARTLLDIAATAPRRLRHAWDEAERRNLLHVPAVQAAMARGPRHPGRRAVMELIARAELPPDVRSQLEQLAWDLILEEQFPRPATNVVVAGHTVDMLFPNGLVVELDSRTHHQRRQAFETDRERDGDLLAAGHPVYRITWEAITERRPRVVARLRTLLSPA